MKPFSTTSSDSDLVVSRRVAPAFLRLAGVSVLFIGTVLLALKPGHGAVHVDRVIAAMGLAGVCLYLLPQIFRDLRRQEFVFDRVRGVFLLNGKLLYPLSALGRVHLDKSRNTVHGGSDDALVLWLQTPERMQIEICRQNFFGANEREMRELAHDIADWTGLDLVLLEDFVAGRMAPAPTPEKTRRFGGKRRLG